MPGLGCGFDLLENGRDLALAAAGPPVWNYLPILDAQYGADVKRCSQEPLRPPEPTALREVLQRPHREEHVAASDGRFRRPPDILEVPALVYNPEGLAEYQARAHLRAPGVEHLHRPLHHLRRRFGRVVGAAELAGEGENQDVVVGVERLVGLYEVPGGGLRSRREHVSEDQALVELLVGEVDFVPVALVWAEVEGQRHDAKVRTLQHARREARGRVRYNRGGHSDTICSGYSGCPPSRVSTSTPSPRPRMPSAILCSVASSSPAPLTSVTTSASSSISSARLRAVSSTLSSTAKSSPSRIPMYAPSGTSRSPTLALRTARVISALLIVWAISRISSTTSPGEPSLS